MCDFYEYIRKYLEDNNIELYDVGSRFMVVKDTNILYLMKDYTLFQLDGSRIHTNFSLYDNTFLFDEEYYDINTLLDIQAMITARLNYGYEFKFEFEDRYGIKHKQNCLSIVVKNEFDEKIDYTNIEEIDNLMDKYSEIFESKKIIVMKFVD